jgi:DNA-binding MarR family transcriptional regulator
MATGKGDAAQVAAIRSFNRFYTRLLGLLDETLLDSPVSLTEARILWEISRSPRCRAEDLIASLGVDRGYLSRILRRLERGGLLLRSAHASDGRMRLLSLTRKGERFMHRLDAQASAQILQILAGLTAGRRARLVAAMGEIQALLSAPRLQGNAAGHTMG